MSHKGLSCCHSSFTSNSHLPPSSSRGGRQSPNDSPRLCKVSLFMVSVVTCPCIFYVKKSGTFLPIKDPNQNREEIHPMPRGESAMISVLVQQLYLNPLPVTQPATPSLKSSSLMAIKWSTIYCLDDHIVWSTCLLQVLWTSLEAC